VIEPPPHFQVFEPGEVLIDGSILAGQPDTRSKRICIFDDVKACNFCPSCIRS